MADDLAVSYREQMKQPLTQVSGNFTMLVINECYVTWDFQNQITTAATKVPIQQYYQTKNGWSKETFNSINWVAQHKVLLLYNNNDQRRILKFAYGGFLQTSDYTENYNRKHSGALCVIIFTNPTFISLHANTPLKDKSTSP
jgi:hypothetical protein